MLIIDTLFAAADLSFASPKTKGEYVEALFLAKLLGMGYIVSKPWGDSAPFDFMVQKPGRTPVRVQVKSCWRRTGNHYAFRTTGNTADHPTYTARDVDFIAALVVPLDHWYVVPIATIEPDQSFLHVFPHRGQSSPRRSNVKSRNMKPRNVKPGTVQPRNVKPGPYDSYLDRWDLLDAPSGAADQPGA